MNRHSRTILVGLALLCGANTVHAQGKTLQPLAPRISVMAKRTDGGTDSQVVVDPRVMAIVVETRRVVPTGLDPAAASQVLEVLLEDKRLDMAEYDFLDELTQPRIRAVALRTADKTIEPLIMGTQSGAVARIFTTALDEHVERILGNPPTPQGWEQILGLAEYSYASELRIRALLTRRLKERLDQSSAGNAYAPFSDLLTLHDKNNATLPPERANAGRILLWMACKDLDNATQDKALPDILYEWVRPKP